MSTGVGVIGAGNISDTYLSNLNGFADTSVLFIADLDTERAAAQAAKHAVPGHGTVDQLLATDDIELVVNLTIPAAHAEIGAAALRAGKHVWQEKPLATDLDDARKLLDLADEVGRRIACAPDTVLGPGVQGALRAIRAGAIGEPGTGLAVFQSSGPDRWHPSPEFLFQAGGGPLFDMGPYYLTTLALVFGSAKRVTATGTRARTSRVIQAGPRAGTAFDVTEPTTVNALIEFHSGASTQFLLSFDSGLSRSTVEITGEAGTIVLPDPNHFDGATKLHPVPVVDPTTMVTETYPAGRGIGAVDLVRSIRAGEPERAGGRLAYHVVEIMTAIDRSAKAGGGVAIESVFDDVPLLPEDWDPFAATG